MNFTLNLIQLSQDGQYVHVVYIEGYQVIISKIYCFSFSEDRLCLSKQYRPSFSFEKHPFTGFQSIKG